jgi:hypothetical protein
MASHDMPWRMFSISSIYGNFAEIKESFRNPIMGVTVNYPTQGFGDYHGTVNVPNPPPAGFFNVISGAFVQQPNPFQVPR